jgi:leucyl/phenylalanyl-tRNA--protein transferase
MTEDPQQIDPDLVVFAYRHGYFPMGEPGTGAIGWFSPDPRGIIPLEGFHLPRSLRRVLARGEFDIRIDTAFSEVVRACAAREETWITREIFQTYGILHQRGLAHSIETWKESTLTGGLYGVALGGAFFGESMFSRVSESSKVALAHLVRILREGGFRLLDVQFLNDHLLQFGAVEVPREQYLAMLAEALEIECRFALPLDVRTPG